MDEWEIAPRFLDLLANTSVQFFKDRVKVLHPSDHWGMNVSKESRCGGTVHLESGLQIEYDWYDQHFLSTSFFFFCFGLFSCDILRFMPFDTY